MKQLFFTIFLLSAIFSYGQTPLDTLMNKACDCFESVDITDIDLTEDDIPDCLKTVMNVSKKARKELIASTNGVSDEDEFLLFFVEKLINECDATYQYYIEGLNKLSDNEAFKDELDDLDAINEDIAEEEERELESDRDGNLYIARGMIYLIDDHNYIGAVEEFQKAQVDEDVISEAAFFEGYAYYKMGDHQSALTAFRMMMTGDDADEPIFFFVLYMAERKVKEY